MSAHRLKQKPNIGERVSELLKQREHINAQATAKAIEKTALTKEWVIERLIENANRAMQNVPVLDRDGRPTGVYRYEGQVANKALELLGKEIGMFVDRTADVSALYAISDEPMTLEDWALEFTGKPLPQ